MGLNSLLKRMESLTDSSVLSSTLSGGTASAQENQGDSLGSLCSLQKSHISTEENIISANTEPQLIKIVCECGYRPPFCACDYYKFRG